MFLQVQPAGQCGNGKQSMRYQANRRTCRWNSVILSIYLGWNSDTDMPFKENAAAAAAADTLPRSSELVVVSPSPYAKAKAGFDGAAKLEDWPWSMTRTSSMVGRSAGFSCTQSSPRWMHLTTSLSVVSCARQSKNGSTVSSAVPLTQWSHT